MNEGWIWVVNSRLRNSRKRHYFMGSISLCRKYFLVGHPELEQGNDSPDNCAACRRELKKRRDKSGEQSKD